MATAGIIYSQEKKLVLKAEDSITENYLKTITYKNKHENRNSIKEELSKIRRKAYNNGYLNIQFRETIQNDSVIYNYIKLNKKYNTIKINYDNNKLKEKILKKIINNKTLSSEAFITNTSKINKTLNDIKNHYNKEGYIFAKVQLKNIKINNGRLSGELTIKKNEKKLITNVKIKGYKKFPRKYIKNYLRIKKNTETNPEIINKKTEKLNSLKFVSELKKPEILFTKDSTIIYLYLKKEKSNNFEGFLGFSNDEKSKKINLNGNINLKLINNLNTGEELHLKYISSENEQKNTEIRIKTPYVLKTPFNITGEIEIFKKDSSFTNNSTNIKIGYNLRNNIETSIGYSTAKSNALIEDNILYQSYSNNFIFTELNHSINSQDNITEFKTKTDFKISFGERKIKKEKTNAKQTGIILNSEYTFRLNYRNSIYIRTKNYYLFSNNTLENENIFIGGINNIRGIKENSIPSTQYSILNSEYRIKLNNNLYTHSVTDYAITKNSTNNKLDKIIGFGIGFGLKTKNNNLRLVYANSKINNEYIRFSESKIHLSLETKF
jgi:translocation and assembly module TamA